MTATRRLGVAAALTPDGVVAGDVEVVGDRVVAVGRAPAGARGLAVPGLIDLHVHGCAGVDFQADGAAGHRRVAPALLATGVTSYQPAFVCAPPDALAAAVAEVAAALPAVRAGAPRLLGAHLEGPFLSPVRLGAHDPGHRRDPDPVEVDRLLAAGAVAEMTLAPELPGSLAVIERLVGRGVVVSLGHTDATAAQVRAAVAAGARSVTHLCNAMRPLHHREPGPIGVALTTAALTVELIVDGHHLADDVVRLVWHAAAGRVALVTDATAAAGMPDGRYDVGGIGVTLADGAVRNRAGALAGSALTMIAAVRNLHALGVPLAAAIGAATQVPARLVGRDDLGALRPGAAADVVVLDDRLEVRAALVAGVRHSGG
jgi:N-acetylglucosamine-6-phosphate deacetylase